MQIVSPCDARIIEDVVATFWNVGFSQIKMQLLRIFAHNITCGHYIYLGYVVGKKSTDIKETEKTNFYAHYN